jgi:hypothetical protein
MIYDPSSRFSGTSVSRLSDYLSLCKIDILVRNREKSRPSCRVDQPGKAGQARTITKSSNNYTRVPVYNLTFRDSKVIGNLKFTLRLKSEMSKQMKLDISSLTEAGSVILQKDNMDLEKFPRYEVISYSDNFANSRKIKWSCCLVRDKNQQWVDAFLSLIKENRFQVDKVIIINQGVIGYVNVSPK